MKAWVIIGLALFCFISAGLMFGVKPIADVPVFPDMAEGISKAADGWWEFTIGGELWYVKSDKYGNPMYIKGGVDE